MKRWSVRKQLYFSIQKSLVLHKDTFHISQFFFQYLLYCNCLWRVFLCLLWCQMQYELCAERYADLVKEGWVFHGFLWRLAQCFRIFYIKGKENCCKNNSFAMLVICLNLILVRIKSIFVLYWVEEWWKPGNKFLELGYLKLNIFLVGILKIVVFLHGKMFVPGPAYCWHIWFQT